MRRTTTGDEYLSQLRQSTPHVDAAKAAEELVAEAKQHMLNIKACLTPDDVHAGDAVNEALEAIARLEKELVFVRAEREEAVNG